MREVGFKRRKKKYLQEPGSPILYLPETEGATVWVSEDHANQVMRKNKAYKEVGIRERHHDA